MAQLKDFELSLPSTNLHIDYLKARNFNKSSNKKLHFEGIINKSKITLQDVACFVPTLKNSRTPMYIAASFTGTDKTLNIRNVELNSHNNNINLYASANISKRKYGVAWNADIKHLTCTGKSINELIHDFLNADTQKIEILERLGNIKYIGILSGYDKILSVDGK